MRHGHRVFVAWLLLPPDARDVVVVSTTVCVVWCAMGVHNDGGWGHAMPQRAVFDRPGEGLAWQRWFAMVGRCVAIRCCLLVLVGANGMMMPCVSAVCVQPQGAYQAINRQPVLLVVMEHTTEQ